MTVNTLSEPPIQPWLVRLRLPVIIMSFGVIMSYLIFSILVPWTGFDSFPTTKGFRISEIMPSSTAEKILKKDDLIIAIDGQPLNQYLDWRWLFPRKSAYTYTIQRGEEIITVELSPIFPPLREIVDRIYVFPSLLICWLVGSLAILSATPRNRDGWRTGFVLVGLGVSWSAVVSRNGMVPGTQTGWGSLISIVITAFAELALLPRQGVKSRWEKIFFGLGYAIAIVLTVVDLVDTFLLYPLGTHVFNITGIDSSIMRSLHMAVFLSANPIIVLYRYWRTPRSYVKQQLRILVICLSLAILPFVAFVVLPSIFFDISNYIAGLTTTPLLALLPISYGYVIYRHKYLNLDLFATQAISLLLIGVFALTLYALLTLAIRSYPGSADLELFANIGFVAATAVLVPVVNKPTLRATQTVLYGRYAPYHQILSRVTAILATSPEVEALRSVVQELGRLLDVRQAALLLVDHTGAYAPVATLGTEVEAIAAADAAQDIPAAPITRAGTRFDVEGEPPLLARYPWIEVLAPIHVGEKWVGVLLLGPRIPDGSFDAFQLAFIRQVCEAIGVTAYTIQLFEASRAMSRDLMRVREAERAQLAAEIHNEPLQRLGVVEADLGHLARQAGALGLDLLQRAQKSYAGVQNTAARLREICVGLQPPLLSEGIQYVIRDVKYKFGAENDLDIHTRLTLPDDAPISDDLTLGLYHILTEALNNIRKHAGAKNVWIDLESCPGQLRFSVADDGRGLGLGGLSLAELVRAKHFGIAGMHEWANLAGGALSLTPRAEGGTVVTLTAPLPASPSEEGY